MEFTDLEKELKGYINPKEFAEQTGLSLPRVYQLIESKKLKAFKGILIEPSDILKFKKVEVKAK